MRARFEASATRAPSAISNRTSGGSALRAARSSAVAPLERPAGDLRISASASRKEQRYSAIGARITIGTQTNHVTTAVGYASARNVHFGLGPLTEVATLTIHWPRGKTQTLKQIRADQILSVKEP